MLSARNGGEIGAGRANSVKARARDSGDLRSALTELVPALCCHYPGQAGILKADSKSYTVILLRCLRDFLLRRNCLLRADLRRVGGLLGNVVAESDGQLVAVVGEDLRIVCSARDRDVSHPAVE